MDMTDEEKEERLERQKKELELRAKNAIHVFSCFSEAFLRL